MPPTAQYAPPSGPPSRRWYTKKRYMVPAGIFVAIGVIGSVSGNGSGKTHASNLSSTSTTPHSATAAPAAPATAASPTAAQVAAAKAAAAKAAAAKAAAARAAAAKAAYAYAHRPYLALTPRQFALLVKDPDSYANKRYVVYGEIHQFDAATGDDTFLADAGATKLYPSYGFVDYSENSEFTGEPSMLANVVEGDLIAVKVTVIGSDSYDTQIGGNTTVPEFHVDSIRVYGHVN